MRFIVLYSNVTKRGMVLNCALIRNTFDIIVMPNRRILLLFYWLAYIDWCLNSWNSKTRIIENIFNLRKTREDFLTRLSINASTITIASCGCKPYETRMKIVEKTIKMMRMKRRKMLNKIFNIRFTNALIGRCDHGRVLC